MKTIKRIKMSDRGITFSDKAMFPIGTEYKYAIDKESNKIVILPFLSTDNPKEKAGTVSRKKRKDGIIPLIDIRNNKNHKNAYEALAGFSHLQVTVSGDEIVIEGYDIAEEQATTAIGKAVNKVKSAFKKSEKVKTDSVVDITDILAVKKKLTVVLSKKDFSKVVGEQVSYDSFDWDVAGEGYTTSSSDNKHISGALKNIHIPLQIASLFSGAGVMDEGFKEAGFDIVFALERDAEAATTYRHNHGDHIHVADITEFDKSTIAKAPVMIGGSPCQGFSNSNRHEKFLDNPNNLLVKHYIDSIKANENCQVFVLENVPQILTAGDGAFRDEVYEALSDFDITSGVLSSANFGDAQERKRAIFIGSKIGKIELPEPYLEPSNYKTVREAFSGLHDGIANQLDVTKGKPTTVERMKHVPQGENWQSIPTHLQTARMMSGNTHSSVYRRLEWDKPSITIANPRKSNITHPEEHRILSVRECARLFGLKDTFEFKGGLSSKQQQICNSVPVQLAKAVGVVIKNAIMQYNIRNRTEGFRLV